MLVLWVGELFPSSPLEMALARRRQATAEMGSQLSHLIEDGPKHKKVAGV